MGETKLTAFRLTEEDLEGLDRLVRAGIAKDRTEALRLAIDVAPLGLAAKIKNDVEELTARIRKIADAVEERQRAVPASATIWDVIRGDSSFAQYIRDRERANVERVKEHRAKRRRRAR